MSGMWSSIIFCMASVMPLATHWNSSFMTIRFLVGKGFRRAVSVVLNFFQSTSLKFWVDWGFAVGI